MDERSVEISNICLVVPNLSEIICFKKLAFKKNTKQKTRLKVN